MGPPNFGVKLMLNINISSIIIIRIMIQFILISYFKLILVVTLLPYRFLMSVLATAMMI